MTPEALRTLPLSRLEALLKRCWEQRGLRERILSAGELAECIGWMAREYGNRPGYEMNSVAISGRKETKITALGRRILVDPGDAQAIDSLSEAYGNQKEDRFIVSDHDMSVGRMLRYMPAHWHQDDYFEVFFSFSGDCPVFFSNETVTVKPGTLLIVAPGVVHASPCYRDEDVLLFYMLRATSFERVFWTQIPSENLMASFFRRALSDRQPNAYLQFDTGEDPDVRELMSRIYDEYLTGEAYSAQMMNSLMSLVFTLLLRRYEGTARLPRTEDFFWKHEYSAILSYIQTHFAEVRLPELGKRFHYSEKQIRRIIQSCTGMSFSELIGKLKMERAAALLHNEELSMEEIASAVGYATVSSFYRAFTAWYGCPPGSFLAQGEKRPQPAAMGASLPLRNKFAIAKKEAHHG